MKRKTLTPDQIAARDERRARFTIIAKQIADMTDEGRAALALSMVAAVTIEGRSLSVNNACLVAIQNPAATLLGGFQQWRQHGRTVRKGEHGIMIWAPTQRTTTPDADGSDGPKFITVTVFDVAQTDAIGVEVAA